MLFNNTSLYYANPITSVGDLLWLLPEPDINRGYFNFNDRYFIILK